LSAFLSAGFTKQQVMEVILIVTIKTLSNYINHLTQPEVNPEVLALL
jgi:alkylhydroperoxidase family enzyme